MDAFKERTNFYKKKNEKACEGTNSPTFPPHRTFAVATALCMWGRTVDVIRHAKFQPNQFRGFEPHGAENDPPSLTWRIALYIVRTRPNVLPNQTYHTIPNWPNVLNSTTTWMSLQIWNCVTRHLSRHPGLHTLSSMTSAFAHARAFFSFWNGKEKNKRKLKTKSITSKAMGDSTFWIIQHDHPVVHAYPVANPKSEVVFFV